MTLSVSTSSSTWATAAAQNAATSSTSRQQQVPRHVQTAANALGMSATDVMSALKSGKSLLDIADDQGVSRDDLLSALKADAPQDLKDSGDLDSAVQALASATGVGGPGGVAGASGPGGAGGPSGHGGHGGHHGPPPTGTTGVLGGSLTSAQQTTLGALSDLLGTDSDTLLGQLQSGSDLTDLLSQKGVTLDQLSSELEDGLLIDTQA